MNIQFYITFPGFWQAELTDHEGNLLGTGMGLTKGEALASANSNLKEEAA